MDFSEKLRGFDKVWRRVQQAKRNAARQPQCIPQPQQRKLGSRARRFDPGGRF